MTIKPSHIKIEYSACTNNRQNVAGSVSLMYPCGVEGQSLVGEVVCSLMYPCGVERQSLVGEVVCSLMYPCGVERQSLVGEVFCLNLIIFLTSQTVL